MLLCWSEYDMRILYNNTINANSTIPSSARYLFVVLGIINFSSVCVPRSARLVISKPLLLRMIRACVGFVLGGRKKSGNACAPMRYECEVANSKTWSLASV